MGTPIRILHLDDNPFDHELLKMTLETSSDDFQAALTYVQTRGEYLAALERRDFDIILSDWRMPGYDGDQALASAREKCPDIPFIMVTGELGEERAIDTLKRGASDYVMKGNMLRLQPAIERALADAGRERKRREADQERERLLREVQRSRGELFAIIQAMNGGVTVFDAEGNVVLVNQAEVQMLGYRHASDLSRNLAFFRESFEFEDADGRLVPFDDWPLAHVMRGESVANRELKGRRKDTGREWFFSFNGRPVTDEAGRQILSVLVTRDITERRRAEDALRESQTRLQSALASMTDAVFISDARGRFIEFNDAFATFHKFKNKDDCYKTLTEYPHILDVFLASGELAPLDMWAVPRALRGETVTNAEYTLHRKDTGETWIGSYSFAPIRDKDGSVAGSVVVARDITEARRADENLRRAERTTGEILESVQDPFYGVDNEWLFTYVNTKAEEFFGKQREQLLGKNIWDIFPALQGTESEVALRTVSETRKPLHYQGRSAITGAWLDVHIFPKADGGLAALYRDISERKQAEDALKRSEERFGAAFRWSPYPQLISRMDDGVFVDVNDAALAFYGMTRDEVIGHSSFEIGILSNPAEREQMIDILNRQGSVRDFPMHVRSRTYGDRQLELSVSVLEASEERTMLTIIRDETERKQTEENRRQSEQRLRVIFEKAPLGIVEVNADDRFIAVNERICQILGYTREELLAMTVHDLTAGEDRGLSLEMNASLRAPGRDVVAYEKRYLKRDGSPVWVNVTVSSLRDPEGRFTGAIGTIEDISARKHAEEELHLAHRKTHEILESIQDAFYATDRDLRITYVNRRAEDALGCKRNDLLGKYLWDAFPEAMGTESQAAVHRAHQEQITQHYEALSPVLKTWVEVDVYPTAEGGVSIYFRDITRRKHTEERLNRDLQKGNFDPGARK